MQSNFYLSMITLGRTEITINFFSQMKCREVGHRYKQRYISGVMSKRLQSLYLAWIIPRVCELQASAFLIHYSHLKPFYRDE